MKYNKVLKEAAVFAKEEEAVIYMINPEAKGQIPPGVKVKKAKKPFAESK